MINKHFNFEAYIPNSSNVDAIKRNDKDLSLKIKGFVLEDQGHQFSNKSDTFRCSINSSSWKVKIKKVQFLKVKINILEV